MEKFRAPYRITTIRDRLVARPELVDREITIEEMPDDREAGYFPTIQYDTARVFVRRGEYSVNVVGVLEHGKFLYRANAYVGIAPWDVQYQVPMAEVDKIIEFIIGKFDTIPHAD